MNILGIETSCDETAAAVVQDGKDVLSNVIATSLKEHQKYGGIIPEIASRRQLEYINWVVSKALEDAQLKLKDIDAVAVTNTPGFIGSLLVGISFARSLSFAMERPLIEVDHIKAHLYANFVKMGKNNAVQLPALPAIGLVVSGGHTSLYHIQSFHNFKLIGQTRDDAAGEAFDKVARIMEIGYPGGPVIDRLSKKGRSSSAIQFKCGAIPNSFDFSFSGVKTAVLYHYQAHYKNKDFSQADVCYAFQKSVVNILVKKSIEACQKFKTKILVVGGGVAANSDLRQLLFKEAALNGIAVYFPPMNLCTDNAVMIAGLGYHKSRERFAYH